VGVESGEAVTVVRRSNAVVPGAVEPVVWWPGGGSVADSWWPVGAWARAVSLWPVGVVVAGWWWDGVAVADWAWAAAGLGPDQLPADRLTASPGDGRLPEYRSAGRRLVAGCLGGGDAAVVGD
jgi:hypothetical protein